MDIIRITDDETKWRMYAIKPEPFIGGVNYFPAISTCTEHVKRRELIEWFKKTTVEEQKEKSGGAASTGTAIHEVLDRFAKTGTVWTPGIDENIIPAIQKFEEFAEKNDLQAEKSEKYVVSKEYGYGGTLDLIGTLNGTRTIIDYKTGRFQNMDLWKTEMYRRAAIEMGEDPSIGTTIIYLDKKGEKKPKVYTIEHHDFCFVAGLSCLFLWKALYFNDLKRAGEKGGIPWDLAYLTENPVAKFLSKNKS